MMNVKATFPVTAHSYRPYAAFEAGSIKRKDVIVRIEGLGDEPYSVQYLQTVAKPLEEAKDPSYSLFEFCLRSSVSGLDTGSLAGDVADISTFDCAEYTHYAKDGSSPVDSFILRAPISGREASMLEFPDTDKRMRVTTQMIAEGRLDNIAPKEVILPSLGLAVSANRLRSLLTRGYVPGIT